MGELFIKIKWNKKEVAHNDGFVTIEALYHNKIWLFYEKKVGVVKIKFSEKIL